MAPEIVNHQEHNYLKADIWALGVIFYALISGRFPFKAQNDKDLYNKIRKWVFTLPEGISLEAKSLLLSMIQSDPNFRKPTSLLLKEPWLSDYIKTRPDISPSILNRRSNIMGTIEKYKKIYSGNRRNIANDNNISAEGRKRSSTKSPYAVNNPYNQTVYDSIKNNSNFIKTYFKNPESSENRELKTSEKKHRYIFEGNTLKMSAPHDGNYDFYKFTENYLHRNSKSNSQLRKGFKEDLHYNIESKSFTYFYNLNFQLYSVLYYQ